MAARALGGPDRADALPEQFSSLMRRCGIPGELPPTCSHLSLAALADAMKSDANVVMARNAACPVTGADLDELAASIMSLPVTEAA